MIGSGSSKICRDGCMVGTQAFGQLIELLVKFGVGTDGGGNNDVAGGDLQVLGISCSTFC